MTSYVDADPTAVVLAWLKGSARVEEEFGGPGHVSGLRQAPWPHLRVLSSPGGTIGNFRERPASPEVAFEVYGHPDGSTGPARLRRLAVVVMEELVALGDADYVPGQPVVHRVEPGYGPDAQDLSSGQQRWIGSVMVTLRPGPS